ncbi:hypothetical protein NC653_004861 [Populus alba x Populus x berolinensis]|nr:hypothetical protein NC653_004861 [Populus alba x Populus x berolinensis]
MVPEMATDPPASAQQEQVFAHLLREGDADISMMHSPSVVKLSLKPEFEPMDTESVKNLFQGT